MKNQIKLSYLLGFIVLNYSLTFAQWTRTNGPSSAGILYIPSLAVSGNNLLAATNAGIFLSSNNGTSWTEIDKGLTNKNVYCVAAENNRIFAGTTDGIFLSTNNGTAWMKENNGMPKGINVRKFVFNGSDVFAGAEPGGVFHSNSKNIDWKEKNNGLLDNRVTCFALSENKLFAGTHGGGVFLSNNAGSSWIEINKGLTNKNILCLAALDNILFAGTEGEGMFRSTDNGTSWHEINSGLTYKNINSMVVKGNNIFVAAEREVFFSSNNGNDWKKVSTGLNSVLLSLAVNEQYIFAGTYAEGVWRCKLSNLLTNVEHEVKQTPDNFKLHQNYPNPFNPSTTLSYSLPEQAKINIEIFNLTGHKIASLADATMEAGNYELMWNAANFSSGIYFCRIKASYTGMQAKEKKFSEKIQKLVLLR